MFSVIGFGAMIVALVVLLTILMFLIEDMAWLRISEISGILKTFDEDAEEWVYRIFFKDGEFTDLCDNEDALELVRLFEQEE